MDRHTCQVQIQPANKYPVDGNTAMPCWFATLYNLVSLHGDCVIDTFNAWDLREYQCDCPCHKLKSEDEEDATTNNGK